MCLLSTTGHSSPSIAACRHDAQWPHAKTLFRVCLPVEQLA